MKMLFKLTIAACVVYGLSACTQPSETSDSETTNEETAEMSEFEKRGFDSKAAWGEHLVNIIGCADCHTPKMMTDHGPEPNPDLHLSGHPADAPPIQADRAKMEQLGQVVANSHFTSYAGPWGISYSSNLTPHQTGLGAWTEEQFFTAIREGKSKGMENGRPLLPPMPWFNFAKMKDAELSAIFAYLKTIKPVDNVVPNPKPPVNPPPGS